MKKLILQLLSLALVIYGISVCFFDHYILGCLLIVTAFYLYIQTFKIIPAEVSCTAPLMEILDDAYKSLIVAQLSTGFSAEVLSNNIEALIFNNQTKVKEIRNASDRSLSPTQIFRIYSAVEAILQARGRGLSVKYILMNFEERGRKLKQTRATEILLNKQAIQVVKQTA